MTNERIEKAIEAGARRWTRGEHDRLYVKPELLGLECEYYKTGNVKRAYWRGNETSNCDANRILAASIWYDLNTDKICIKNPPKHHDEALFEAAREFFA